MCFGGGVARSSSGAALTRFHICDGARCAKIAAIMRSRKALWLGLLALTAVGGLSGCHKDSVTDDPQHDVRTEGRREQDCADPQWKAANLGLWYNICSGDQN